MNSLYFEQKSAFAQTLPLNELLEKYLQLNPKHRDDTNKIKAGFQAIFELFPACCVNDFRAIELVHVQQHLCRKTTRNGKPYSRQYVDKLINSIRSVFYWGVQFNLVSPNLAYSLRCVKPVRYGTTREAPKRTDVPFSDVEKTLRFLPATVADMVRIQLATAMRPNEGCRMKAGEIQQGIQVETWVYEPTVHKNTWRGKTRKILLGKIEMDILQKYLTGKNADEPVFQNDSGREYHSEHYSRIICKTIRNNNLPKWTPYQLRHTKITEISKEYGSDVAAAFAGHSSLSMMNVYDHSAIDKAYRVVLQTNSNAAATLPYAGNVVAATEYCGDKPILRIYRGD